MIYCEGKYCSRRAKCAYHEMFEWKYPRQILDQSTQGFGYDRLDANGDHISHHECLCGDRSVNFYPFYKALGWREGQEYRNSKGTICAEECVACEHSNLCSSILEFAGMIFQPGERIRFDCEQIKANPEGKQKWLADKLAEWRKQMEEVKRDYENNRDFV